MDGRPIRRSVDSIDVTVDASAASSSTVVPYGGAAGGTIFVPTGSSITTLTFHVAPGKASDMVALYNTSNTAVTLTVASDRAYPIPDECYGSHSFTVTGNASGTVTVVTKT